MNTPFDQPQRTRFITELERNFSVVASAGSGKTRAITDRIIALARSAHASEWLPSLVVVTYTNRAAGEMQQRARQSILEAGVSIDVIAAFNRAFFGTIHSLCMKLLRQYGHHLGLPGRLDHLDDDRTLWMEFVQQHTTVGAGLPEGQRRALLQLAPARLLLELGRGGCPDAPPPGELPALNFEAIHAFAAKGPSKNTVARSQAALQRWENEWRSGGFAPLPKCESKPLQATWDGALGAWREWLRRAALFAAAEIAREYRRFRLLRGAMTYDDQISLAGELLRHPEAARRIRAKNFRVILDEAQDTDPGQFDVLLEMTRTPEAAGGWLERQVDGPRAGHFCMVGDFQQAIFGERADLTHYRAVHHALTEADSGEALEFSVTFRLDQEPLDFVNAAFPRVLHGADEQVAFVPLNPRPGVLPGQIVRFDPGLLPDLTDWRDGRKARYEAQFLARWIKEQGLARLRAESWREVAILCPRTLWFPPIREALRAEGFDVQLQSDRALKGDSPAYAWFTALAVVMAQPRNSYEIVGVLREVFGVSDHDLAVFAEGRGDRFQITAPTTRRGSVGDALNRLAELRAEIVERPLFSAMNEIVHRTQLRERLAILPETDFENLDAELDDLLTLTATAEAKGGTLAALADELRAGFNTKRETRTTERNAIQLITCHKAKGSEWQAVIVPGFARGVRSRSGDYPALIHDPRDGVVQAVLEGADVDAGLKEALKRQTQQELERLLYVALTRAKHTLVLVQDHELFAGKKDLPTHAAARLLGEGLTPSAAFLALPSTAAACPATAGHHTARRTQRVEAQEVARLIEPAPGFSASARRQATAFLKRNPSALAEAAFAEADPAADTSRERRAARQPNAGQRYGTWWHEFVERLDWTAPAKSWDAVFRAALSSAPDPAQAEREWKLLRTQLTSDSPLNHWLCGADKIAQVETPFLWAMSEHECLDGIMDLAVFDPATESWLILDWKTNRTEPAKLPQLRAHYLPQLSAYWRAASAMLGAPVNAGIYSTATGRWLPYETSELTAAWERLRAAPTEIERALGED